ncbi:type IV secretion system protein [Brevundimonas kwangchunensis]|uniref:Type IV secretion system protein n=1 Tax=Brevundimonas kwangchunensis TaxID=322163 RepID=A0ABN1GXC3_9CAUL
MKKSNRNDLKAYYAEGDSWAADRLSALRASRRTAWWVAGAAVCIALAEAAALVILMPLKTVEPYTLLVDRNTGYVQALAPLDAAQITPDRALTQSMLVQYVIAREGFDRATVQADYRKVGLWSAETARQSYLDLMRATNADSPLVRYPVGARIETRVKSVSPLGTDTAMVRYDTVQHDAGGGVLPLQSWVAIVRYRYSGEPMAAADRYLNPLGFQVIEYRRDAETLHPETAPVAPAIEDDVILEPVEAVEMTP